MTQPKLDRRVRRTRRMFREAILTLVTQTDFDDITVTQIVEAAGLRRATFYLHYSTKEDLLRSALSSMNEEASPQQHSIRDVDAYYVVFQHVADNASLYRRLLRGSSAVILGDHIQGYMNERITIPKSSLPDVVVAQFFVRTVTSMAIWWLEESPAYTPQDMAQMTHHMTLEGIAFEP